MSIVLRIINKEQAIDLMGGDEETFIEMVKQFEPMSIVPDFKGISEAWNKVDHDWKSIKRHCHSLKGASSYIGADRLNNAAKQCEDAANETNLQLFAQLYSQLATEALKLKREIATKYNGMYFLYSYIFIYYIYIYILCDSCRYCI